MGFVKLWNLAHREQMSKVEVLIHGERQAHEEGNLRWRWKDHGRGKRCNKVKSIVRWTDNKCKVHT